MVRDDRVSGLRKFSFSRERSELSSSLDLSYLYPLTSVPTRRRREVFLRAVFWILLFSSPKGLNISRKVFSLVDTDYVNCIRVCVNREYDSIFLSEEIGLEKAR